jgi:predicted Zn-ribbon and HTH transcriptional regulator
MRNLIALLVSSLVILALLALFVIRENTVRTPHLVPGPFAYIIIFITIFGIVKFSLPVRKSECNAVFAEYRNESEAEEVHKKLKDAGIDSYIDLPRISRSTESTRPRILVPSAQLGHAIRVTSDQESNATDANPHNEAPAFEPPHCRKCGSAETVLEAVDPGNTWRCESCETTWTEEADAKN